MTVLGGGIGAGLNIGGGLIGAGLDIGGAILEPVTDLASDFITGLVDIVLREHSRRHGIEIRLVGLVSAQVQNVSGGKLYSLVIRVEVNINNFWVAKTMAASVFCPYIGLPSLQASEIYELGA